MPSDVRVHTLRLHQPLPALGRNAQAWAEDALRCASLPSRWQHRWVLVRRLQVRLGARADATALSRSLSARWSELAASAEPGETATPQASAVWFADEPAARLAWAQRRMAGQPCTAWFWAQVMPQVRAEEGQGANWVEQAQAPWRTPVPAVRHAAFVRELAALRAGGQPAPLRAGPEAAAVRAHEAAQPGSAAFDGVSPEPRPVQPPARVETAPVGFDAAAIAPATPTAAQPALAMRKPAPATAGASTRPNAAGGLSAQRPPSTAFPATAAAQMPRAADANLPRDAALVQPQTTRAPTALLDPGLRTAWGGFFFVLALWRHSPPPDADTATGWLQALAAWLRLPADDGVAVWLASLGAAPGFAQPALPLRALRLQALQACRLPLRRLLAGPGLLRANATHVDMHLPLRSVRLGVRRAGLDLDPGWQPVLARAIHFHYEAR